MDFFIQLDWKEFSVNLDKVRAKLKAILSSNYDGLTCNEQNLCVVFFEEISQEDVDAVDQYWSELTASSFNPTIDEIIDGKVNSAVQFGVSLIASIAKDNVKMGITQMNKTKEVSDYCSTVARYLREGSLYAAMGELDTLKAAGVPIGLDPFVTEDKLDACKAKIQTFLSS